MLKGKNCVMDLVLAGILVLMNRIGGTVSLGHCQNEGTHVLLISNWALLKINRTVSCISVFLNKLKY